MRLNIWLLLALLLGGCLSYRVSDPRPVPITPQKLNADLRTLETLQPQLKRLDDELLQFKASGGWQTRGYFDAEETRKIEYLLNRYVTMHTTLFDMVDSYGSLKIEATDDENQGKGNLLSATAALQLISQISFLVAEFAGDEIAIRQINQVYYRSEIPFGSYDKARSSCTDPDKRSIVREYKKL